MKVVDVAEFYAEQGGGVRTYINQKLTHGSAAGHDVLIVAPGPETTVEERLGGRIAWVKGPPMPFDPRYYIMWREKVVHEILDREQPDLVEGSSPWTGGWFTARWKGKAPKAFIFHQDPVAVFPQTMFGKTMGYDRVDKMFFWFWKYLKKLSNHYQATIVSGHWLAERLARFGVHRPRAVPFGIDKSRFSPEHRDQAVRRDLLEKCDLPEDGKLLITVSRLHPEKRLGTLINAMEKVSSDEKAGLVIYGDGTLKNWLSRKAKRVGNIHLAGYTRDRESLATAMASADAMLHGSSAETYGIVIAEAICSGLPLIVPSVGGANDLAGPQYAETYNPGDATDCARAIQTLLNKDRSRLSEASLEAAETKVATVSQHFEGLFKLYQEMAADS